MGKSGDRPFLPTVPAAMGGNTTTTILLYSDPFANQIQKTGINIYHQKSILHLQSSYYFSPQASNHTTLKQVICSTDLVPGLHTLAPLSNYPPSPDFYITSTTCTCSQQPNKLLNSSHNTSIDQHYKLSSFILYQAVISTFTTCY